MWRGVVLAPEIADSPPPFCNDAVDQLKEEAAEEILRFLASRGTFEI